MLDFVQRILEYRGVPTSVVLVTLMLFAELGFRLGLKLYRNRDEARKGLIGNIQGAVLGLLALLLGFTFSMAVERFEVRRSLIVEEANSIGTTWLRAGLLSDSQTRTARPLLKEYVDVRLRAHDGLTDPALEAEVLRRSAQLQLQLWEVARAAALAAPDDITATYIESLNEMIDTSEDRLDAARNRIPLGVWFILVVVAAFGCGTSSYAAGAEGVRSALTNVLLPLLVTVVIYLTIDVANERLGYISVTQQPLIDLQGRLQKDLQ